MKIEAPFKPTLSDNSLDVTNFDKTFTNEEAIVSVIQPQKMNKVNANADSFKNFCWARMHGSLNYSIPTESLC